MKNYRVNGVKFNIHTILIALIVFYAGCITSYSIAAEPVDVQLERIETDLFGVKYSNQTETERLKRIEDSVFGTVNAKLSVSERIVKINQALGIESLAEASAPLSDLYAEEADGVNYPVVDNLEMQLLSKNYKDENIYKRLERLEKKVFGNSQKGDLANRTDALRAKVAMYAPSSSMPGYSGDEYYAPKTAHTWGQGSGPAMTPEDMQRQRVLQNAMGQNSGYGSGSYNDGFGYGGSDASLQLAGLENTLFGQTFSHDPVALRLNRLERKIFQRDFATDDDTTRMARLQAASTAKKTAKYYDNNKMQKYASTGMQLGTFILMILAMIL